MHRGMAQFEQVTGRGGGAGHVVDGDDRQRVVRSGFGGDNRHVVGMPRELPPRPPDAAR